MNFLTTVTLGRDWTGTETNACLAEAQLAIDAGLTTNLRAHRLLNGDTQRLWVSEAAANDWIAFLNRTVDPAPVNITVASLTPAEAESFINNYGSIHPGP